MNSIYAINHPKILDKIVIKKRMEMITLINNYLKKLTLDDALDIGTTSDIKQRK